MVRQGNSLAVVRPFMQGFAYFVEIEALRPGRAVVEIQQREWAGGYTPWQTYDQINFIVTAGPCSR